MHPRLKSLSLSGFRSFVDEDSTKFPKTGLVLLQGHNKDTGGSSGSGKSSTLLAIAFALGYSPYPATALGSRGAKTSLKVDLTLETDQGDVRIRRGSSSPQLWVGGEQVKGGAKAVEDRLQQLLGVDSEMLALLTYRGQRKPGLFLSKTDAEKKELLTRLLRLDRFEDAIEAGATNVKNLEASVETAQGGLAYAQERLAEFPQARSPEEVQAALTAAGAQQTALEQALVRAKQLVEKAMRARQAEAQQASDAFSLQLAEARTQRSAIVRPAVVFDDSEVSHLRTMIDEASSRIDVLLKADETSQQEIRAKRQLLQKKVLSCRQLSGQQTVLEQQQERADDELKALEADTCPTCERPWDQAEKQKGALLEQLTDLAKGIQQCIAAGVTETKLQAELAALPEFTANPMIAKFKEVKTKGLERLRGESDRRKAAESAADASYREACALVESTVSSLTNAQWKAREQALSLPHPELDKATEAVGNIQQKLQRSSIEVALLEQELEQAALTLVHLKRAQEVVADSQTACTLLQLKLNEEKDLLAAIGREGFLGSIFDEVLEEISDETNKILASVANTRHCVLTFKSESTTQKGTIKRAIVPVITIDGEEAPLEAGTSGGMLSAIELAVDLAVGAVLSRREGVCPGWLILDESFSGLGVVEMESCMEILARYAQDRLVLIVDHATEFKSLFTKTITVEYEAGHSRFVA